MTPNLTDDLNTTIIAAVNARVEAAVAEAFASDETFKAYVVAALQAPHNDTGRYHEKKQTVLQKMLGDAIREATKAAIAKVLIEDAEVIEDLVRKAFRSGAAGMAKSMSDGLTEQLRKGYGVQVNLRLPWERD